MTLEDSTIQSEAGERSASPKSPAIAWLFPTEQGAIHRLQRASMSIGRDAECSIQLQSASVSRRHAEIYRQGPIYAIRDLGSLNGVYIDGKRVVHAPLRPGQILRIGAHVGYMTTVDAGMSSTSVSIEELAPGLIGGVVLKNAIDPLRRAAAHKLPVIIQGETGTGKELIARAIHRWSERTGPLHAINCAAIPMAMVEGELFGYRKGAFTGAEKGHLGQIRAAHRGTLFLDEILDLSLAAQATLLRVLERGEVMPLGESTAFPVDVLVVCASQHCLRGAVQAGRFRADLYARLAGHTCVVPALRDRREDIPALFITFLKRFSGEAKTGVDSKLIERLCLYEWPQNVRELELLTRSLSIIHEAVERLTVELLPTHVRGSDPINAAPDDFAIGQAPCDRKEYERQRLLVELKHSKGNMARAAARVGVSRQRAYRLIAGRDTSVDAAGPTPNGTSEDGSTASNGG